MSELKENLEKVLEDYIDSLDNEEENRELLLKLKKASKDSIKARSYYREARINQYFYYRRLAIAREESVVNRARMVFKEREQKREHVNIWAYFNNLRENKNLSWGEILSTVNFNPRLACDIQKGDMDLRRITPRILAKITELLEGDPKKVVNLAYRFFVESQNIMPTPRVVSYREVREGFVHDGKNGGGFEKKDEERQEMLEYLRELEELFS